MRWSIITEIIMQIFTVAFILWLKKPHWHMKPPGTLSGNLFMQQQERKLFSPAELLKALTWLHIPGADKTLNQEMKLLSPPWNIIPILYPGKSYVKRKELH